MAVVENKRLDHALAVGPSRIWGLRRSGTEDRVNGGMLAQRPNIAVAKGNLNFIVHLALKISQ